MTLAVHGQNHFVNYTPGCDEEIVFQYKDKVIKTFGVTTINRNGRKLKVMSGFKISGARRGIYNQRREHGYVGEKAPHNPYAQLLFDAMFKGW